MDPPKLPDIELIPAEQVDDLVRSEMDTLAAEHRDEFAGLLTDWGRHPASHAFVVRDRAASRIVGLVSWTGTAYAADPSWWISKKGKGYGTRAVELLADELVKAGVQVIGPIRIDTRCGEFDEPSRRLAQRLRTCFEARLGERRRLRHS